MGVSILHLEDSRDEAFFVYRHLRAKKPECQVTWVSDRTAFQEMLAGRGFDVILSDYRLPDWNGDEVLSYVVWHYAHIPVIVLTGELREDQAYETLSRGASDYVLKANLRRLVPSIERALRDAPMHPSEGQDIHRTNAQDGTFPGLTFDPETLQILDANRAVVEGLGYAREEILSMRVDRLWAEEDAPRFRWHLGALRLNRQANFHGRYRRRDGSLLEAVVQWSDLERKGRRVCVDNARKVFTPRTG